MTQILFPNNVSPEDSFILSNQKLKCSIFIIKKIHFALLGVFISLTINAQVSKSLSVTPGSLSSALTATELETITSLTLTGSIDARDFKTMRDNLLSLASLDLSGASILAYNGLEGTMSLSTFNNNYPANAIPDFAFFNPDTYHSKTSLVSVIIPDSVTSVGKSAFGSCIGLTTVTLPSSLISIGSSAFSFCLGLTSVTIPSSVKSIGGYAFYSCSNLTSISIPSSVTTIGSLAFYYCRGLTSINIPQSVNSIGNYAFEGCSGLTTVIIPSSVNSIREGVFGDCSGLIAVIIPSSVKSIGNHAFRGCSGLTSVSIPSSVASIGNYAFQSCNTLSSIIASNPIPINFSPFSFVFKGIDKATCTLYVPVGSKSDYQAADQWKDFINIVETDFTGINPIIIEKQINVIPNPTSGKARIVIKQGKKNGTNITVTDISGKIILRKQIKNEEEWIDLAGNAPGIYFIRSNLPNSKGQKVILK